LFSSSGGQDNSNSKSFDAWCGISQFGSRLRKEIPPDQPKLSGSPLFLRCSDYFHSNVELFVGVKEETINNDSGPEVQTGTILYKWGTRDTILTSSTLNLLFLQSSSLSGSYSVPSFACPSKPLCSSLRLEVPRGAEWWSLSTLPVLPNNPALLCTCLSLLIAPVA
jgi:hypothetical protein